MAESGRRSRIVSLGPFSAAMTFAGSMAGFASFAPNRDLQAVDIKAPAPRSGVDALAGDFGRLAGDMREAAEHLGGRSDKPD